MKTLTGIELLNAKIYFIAEKRIGIKPVPQKLVLACEFITIIFVFRAHLQRCISL